MKGLFGWSRRDEVGLSAGAAAKLRSAAPAAELAERFVLSREFVAAFGVGASASIESGKLSVAICGEPRWPDPDLRKLADLQGQAAALAEAYRRFDTSVPEKISGSFALAILDVARQRVLLAIDRIGIESLCYSQSVGGLFFGSNLDLVAAHDQVDTSIDAQSLYHYLYFHVVPSPRSIYAGIRKLEPGQLVVIDRGIANARRYWTTRFADRRDGLPPGAEQTFMSSLAAAVEEDSRGARTGCFLSGGIDSSTITGLLSGQLHDATHAFTIAFPVEQYNETEFANHTLRRFMAKSHVHVLTPHDVVDSLPKVASGYDEPFGNSSAIPSYWCARMAREAGFDRLLAGDGGDELFGGNSRYATQYLFEQYWRLPEWLRRGAVESVLLSRPLAGVEFMPVRKLRRYVEQARIPLPDRLQTYNHFSLQDPRQIVHPDLLAAIDLAGPLEELRAVYAAAPAEDAIDRMLFLDWKLTLADNDLRKVSRTAALAGIEVRYPWLNDAVVDFSMTLPATQKVRGTQLRYFAKRALTGFLPDEVIHKPKHGFGLPFGVWMNDEAALRNLATDALNALMERKIVQPTYIQRLLTLHREGHAHYYGEFIWILVVLELWLQSRRIGP